MASGQTENYGLNQWAAEDAVLREEFNRDNAKTEAIVEEIAAELLQRPQIIFGTYEGNDEAVRDIALGFTPKGLLICTSYGQFANSDVISGGICAAGYPCNMNGRVIFEIIDGGIRVYQDNSASISLNYAPSTYYYLAVL